MKMILKKRKMLLIILNIQYKREMISLKIHCNLSERESQSKNSLLRLEIIISNLIILEWQLLGNPYSHQRKLRVQLNLIDKFYLSFRNNISI